MLQSAWAFFSSFPTQTFPNRSMCGKYLSWDFSSAEKGALLVAGQRKPQGTFQRFFQRGATKKLRDHITSSRRNIVSYGCYHHITIVNYIFYCRAEPHTASFSPKFEGLVNHFSKFQKKTIKTTPTRWKLNIHRRGFPIGVFSRQTFSN